MGGILSLLVSAIFPGSPKKVCIVGLDNAGKTTILYALHLGTVVLTQPTIGSNVEEVKHNNVKFECWDIGGQQSLRQSWATYYRNTDAVVLVVDSQDRARMGIVKSELQKIIDSDELGSAVLLVFANKQDLRDAMSVAEITELLAMHTIKSHDWHIQPCCALTGEGLHEGLGWIAQRVSGAPGLPGLASTHAHTGAG